MAPRKSKSPSPSPGKGKRGSKSTGTASQPTTNPAINPPVLQPTDGPGRRGSPTRPLSPTRGGRGGPLVEPVDDPDRIGKPPKTPRKNSKKEPASPEKPTFPAGPSTGSGGIGLGTQHDPVILDHAPPTQRWPPGPTVTRESEERRNTLFGPDDLYPSVERENNDFGAPGLLDQYPYFGRPSVSRSPPGSRHPSADARATAFAQFDRAEADAFRQRLGFGRTGGGRLGSLPDRRLPADHDSVTRRGMSLPFGQAVGGNKDLSARGGMFRVKGADRNSF